MGQAVGGRRAALRPYAVCRSRGFWMPRLNSAVLGAGWLGTVGHPHGTKAPWVWIAHAGLFWQQGHPPWTPFWQHPASSASRHPVPSAVDRIGNGSWFAPALEVARRSPAAAGSGGAPCAAPSRLLAGAGWGCMHQKPIARPVSKPNPSPVPPAPALPWPCAAGREAPRIHLPRSPGTAAVAGQGRRAGGG